MALFMPLPSTSGTGWHIYSQRQEWAAQGSELKGCHRRQCQSREWEAFNQAFPSYSTYPTSDAQTVPEWQSVSPYAHSPKKQGQTNEK